MIRFVNDFIKEVSFLSLLVFGKQDDIRKQLKVVKKIKRNLIFKEFSKCISWIYRIEKGIVVVYKNGFDHIFFYILNKSGRLYNWSFKPTT